MNLVALIGRLTRNPSINFTQGPDSMIVARYTLAVDRFSNKENDADFISCVAFKKNAEFAQKYLMQGTKIAVLGHIRTGSYTNREGNKVYTTDVIVDRQEFAESKASSGQNAAPEPQEQHHAQQNVPTQSVAGNGFMTIPDGIEEELPFI